MIRRVPRPTFLFFFHTMELGHFECFQVGEQIPKRPRIFGEPGQGREQGTGWRIGVNGFLVYILWPCL